MRHFLLFAMCSLLLPACGGYDLEPDNVSGELAGYGRQHAPHHIRIKTCMGTIVCELFEDTPLHRANMLRLIEKGFYSSDAEFYRVKESFMAQGGDPTRREPGYLIPAEIRAKHFHRRGALAAARRDANPGMASNPADFYLVTGEGWDAASLAQAGIPPTDSRFAVYVKEGGYPYLDGKYTVFGQVIEGMDVVERISKLRTQDERPIERVLFQIEAF